MFKQNCKIIKLENALKFVLNFALLHIRNIACIFISITFVRYDFLSVCYDLRIIFCYAFLIVVCYFNISVSFRPFSQSLELVNIIPIILSNSFSDISPCKTPLVCFSLNTSKIINDIRNNFSKIYDLHTTCIVVCTLTDYAVVKV